MNFKRFHESKNLLNFDDLKNAESGTINAKNGQETFAVPHVLLIQAQPNTVYVLSTNYEKTGSKTNVIYYNYADASYAVYSTNSVYMTTSETGLIKIAFFDTRIGADDFLSGDSWLMLNAGSTPQPYEPYSSEVWHDIPYYQHKTATDTLTLPAVIYPNDTSITVDIKGKTTQSGTPSPSNPVDVNGTGERTKNLFPMSWYENKTDITVTEDTATGTCDRFFNVKLSIPSELYGQTLTWSVYIKRPDNANAVRTQTVDNGTYRYGNNITGEGRSTVTFTGTSTVRLYINYANTGTDTIELSDITLNVGSESLQYEPYGYKIPISMGGTTNNVYLGEVQTERKIKKLVLTGQEDWTRTANKKCYYINLEKGCPADYLKSNIITVICSHYEGQKNTSSGSNEVNEGCICFFTGVGYELYIGEGTITTAADFKTYLQQQYTNGTPVCVWYVLATPQTAVVNEPLMKIGSYSDSLSTTIPCTAGENTLDVQTTVQPSEITVNYKGWHPVSSAHERENGQWD